MISHCSMIEIELLPSGGALMTFIDDPI